MPRHPAPRRILAAGLAGALALAAPASAQDRGNEEGGTLEDFGREAERALRDLLGRLAPEFDALRDVLRDLDRYEPPEILPNGDILIRRKRSPPPPADPAPKRAPDLPQSTET